MVVGISASVELAPETDSPRGDGGVASDRLQRRNLALPAFSLTPATKPLHGFTTKIELAAPARWR
jgi:hypothetical protein